jgi:formamidopyrimidine-DNA glycosylase
MPELPEVEIARRNLVRWLEPRRVVKAEADKTRIFRGANRRAFERLHGKLAWTRRRGKYLLVAFEGGEGFLSHLGMTGKWVRREAGQKEPFSKARLHLDDGTVIHFRDPRMFGRIEPVPADRLVSLPAFSALGLDPLEDRLTPKALKEAVGHSRQAIKVALMDQARIAGLGNLHVAEALFRSRLHPARNPSTLEAPEWAALSRGIHATIRFALNSESQEEIEYVEEPGAENPFFVYGRRGEKCRRCKTPIETMTQGGRTTYFCPGCQKKRPKR